MPRHLTRNQPKKPFNPERLEGEISRDHLKGLEEARKRLISQQRGWAIGRPLEGWEAIVYRWNCGRGYSASGMRLARSVLSGLQIIEQRALYHKIEGDPLEDVAEFARGLSELRSSSKRRLPVPLEIDRGKLETQKLMDGSVAIVAPVVEARQTKGANPIYDLSEEQRLVADYSGATASRVRMLYGVVPAELSDRYNMCATELEPYIPLTAIVGLLSVLRPRSDMPL